MQTKKVWLALLAVVALCYGCATESDREFRESMAEITRVEPPLFMTQQVADAFGTANFSARVEVRRNPTDSRVWMTGDLFGRGGSLFFAADEPGRKRKVVGKLTALWHAPTKTAYLLNDPLQAFAPIQNAAVKDVVVTRDAANFPAQIQLTNGVSPVSLTISKARAQSPPPELFELPDGFKAYPSTEALMAELMRRRTEALDANLRSKRGGKLDDLPDMTTPNTARPTRY